MTLTRVDGVPRLGAVAVGLYDLQDEGVFVVGHCKTGEKSVRNKPQTHAPYPFPHTKWHLHAMSMPSAETKPPAQNERQCAVCTSS